MSSFYCPELTNDSLSIELIDSEFHHLVNVLRHIVGDEIAINNGRGQTASGTIELIEKKRAKILIHEVIHHNELLPDFAIAFSLLRNKNDIWLVEKVTELGVKHLFPMITRYSVRNPSANTITKFEQASLSAIKQCDNPYLPFIHPVFTITQAIKEIQIAGYQVVVASEHRPEVKMSNLPKDVKYCIMIGPEGGFSEDEFNIFQEYNITQVSISSLILRAETAAITAAAQITSF